ncbi:unnamed protein product, partial [Phaeothamnion confervicola]
RLHAGTRAHERSWTEAALAAAFGAGWSKNLRLDAGGPVGSGAVAQVHRGELMMGDERTLVAIKVLHPSVRSGMELDLGLMRFTASLLEALPRLKWLSLRESVDEFGDLMQKQLDLRLEARNLNRFRHNFARREGVVFPEPVQGWVSEHVLVESFESGDHISSYLDKGDSAFRKRLARLGLSAFLDMVFTDNFMHGDLHPGNILVQQWPASDASERTSASPRLVFLDVGIVSELGPKDRRNFVDLFYAIVRGDGREAGRLMISRARDQRCKDPEAFQAAIEELVDGARARDLRLGEVHVAELLRRVLALCCIHQVKLESKFAAVVVAIAVLEGVGRSLDPDLNILQAAGPALLKAYLQTRTA